MKEKEKKKKNTQVDKVLLPVFCHVHSEVPETFVFVDGGESA